LSTTQQRRLEMTARRRPVPGRHEILLTSIGWSTNEEGLRWHFQDCGPIKQVVVFRERQDVERSSKKKGQSCGRGKIVFGTAEAAEKALRKNLTTLDNWTICVTTPDAQAARPSAPARYWHDTRVLHVPPQRPQRSVVPDVEDAPRGPGRPPQERREGATAAAAAATAATGVAAPAATGGAGAGAGAGAAGAAATSREDRGGSFVGRLDDEAAGLRLGELRNLSFREWLETIDSRGSLLQYEGALECQLDSLPHLLSVYVRRASGDREEGRGRGPTLDESFFEDAGIRKMGHRRLFKRWFESVGCVPDPPPEANCS